MFNMLIQCTSLGNPPRLKDIQNCFLVEKNGTPIKHIWDWTAECSKRNGGIKNLLIACHGLYQNDSAHDEMGGFGIRLGTGLTDSNVVLTKVLQGLVRNIYLYVCGGAQDPDFGLLGKNPDPEDMVNNRVTCIRMAEYTRCNVYASRNIQRYGSLGWLSFGGWEGTVERFTYIDRGSNQSGVVQATNVTSRMSQFGWEAGNE